MDFNPIAFCDSAASVEKKFVPKLSALTPDRATRSATVSIRIISSTLAPLS